jgi:coenzyme F420 hydrogenase subunit beta
LTRWLPLEAKVTLAAKATGPIQSAMPNDIIRSILTAGRSAGLLDGIILLDLEPWSLEPVARVIDTVEDIATSLGPQYLWAPVLDVLNDAVFTHDMRDIAIVGTPCTAQAIRKLRESQHPFLQPYQDSIRLTLSVFCTGTYQANMVHDLIVTGMGIPRDHIKSLNLLPEDGDMQVHLWNGDVHVIPMQEVEKYTLPGCGTCDDYLGESADVAIGSTGTSEEFSTLIIRTRTGDVFVRNAIQMGLLETQDAVDEEELKIAAKDKARRARAQDFNELNILMLDALADPMQRNQVIQQFVRLYRTPTRSIKSDQPRGSCTGC